jgi:hypothetical protein
VLRALLRELAALKEKKERQLQAAERELAQCPNPAAAASLLEELSLIPVDSRRLSEEDFRSLLEAMQLEGTYDPRARQLTMSIVLSPLLLGPDGTRPLMEPGH